MLIYFVCWTVTKRRPGFQNFVEVAQQKLTFPFHTKSITLLEAKVKTRKDNYIQHTQKTITYKLQTTQVNSTGRSKSENIKKKRGYIHWTPCD